MADKDLRSITFLGLPDRYVIPDYSGAIQALETEIQTEAAARAAGDSLFQYALTLLEDAGREA